MKTIRIPPQSTDLNALLEEARREDVILRAPDGSEFMLTAVDDFDWEIVQTRRSTRLMALLDERAQQENTVPLDEVRRKLGLGE